MYSMKATDVFAVTIQPVFLRMDPSELMRISAGVGGRLDGIKRRLRQGSNSNVNYSSTGGRLTAMQTHGRRQRVQWWKEHAL